MSEQKPLFLVRRTDIEPVRNPYDGSIEIRTVLHDAHKAKLPWARQTVHFSINHTVTGHEGGNWDNCRYTIIAPYNGVVDDNGLPYSAEGMHDTYFLPKDGKLKLPSESVVIKVGYPLAYGEIGKESHIRDSVTGDYIIPRSEDFTVGQVQTAILLAIPHPIDQNKSDHLTVHFNKKEDESFNNQRAFTKKIRNAIQSDISDAEIATTFSQKFLDDIANVEDHDSRQSFERWFWNKYKDEQSVEIMNLRQAIISFVQKNELDLIVSRVLEQNQGNGLNHLELQKAVSDLPQISKSRQNHFSTAIADFENILTLICYPETFKNCRHEERSPEVIRIKNFKQIGLGLDAVYKEAGESATRIIWENTVKALQRVGIELKCNNGSLYVDQIDHFVTSSQKGADQFNDCNSIYNIEPESFSVEIPNSIRYIIDKSFDQPDQSLDLTTSLPLQERARSADLV
jgi:hypothetical protein